MHLIAPASLFLLIPLVGALVVLYLLRLRRRDHLVSSVSLWHEAMHDLQANVPFQRLRRNLLFLVQLLLLLIVVAALARPTARLLRPGGRDVFLILDASASMQATDVFPTRFAIARRAALSAVEALGPGDRMMVVLVGGATRALTPLTGDGRSLREAISAIKPSDCPGDLLSALEVVDGLARARDAGERPEVVVISDGALPEAGLPSGFRVPVHYRRIGLRSDNVGIVALDVRRRLSAEGGAEGMLAVRNYASATRSFTIETLLSGALRDACEVTIAAGATHREVLSGLPASGGELELRLDVSDDLPLDNSAHIMLPRHDPLRVVLVSPGNLFLRTALSLDPTLDVVVRDGVPAALDPGTVLVVDNVPLKRFPDSAPVLAIGPSTVSSPGAPGRLGGSARASRIVEWDRRHPALAGVDLAGVHVGRAVSLLPGNGARSLVDGDEGPLALATEMPRRAVLLGWDLHASDFPLRASFPVFISNCLDWLAGGATRSAGANFRTGAPAEIPVPDAAREVTLIAPDSRRQQLRVSGAVVTVPALLRAGVYTVRSPAGDTRFAANLLDAVESDIAPRDVLRVTSGGAPVAAKPGMASTEREFWRMLVALSLLVLCVEWWLFHRRAA